MHHPFPKPFNGNYPFAVLHAVRTLGFPEGVNLALKLSKDKDMTVDDAEAYTAAVVATNGNPQILDLIEGEKEEA